MQAQKMIVILRKHSSHNNNRIKIYRGKKYMQS